MAETKELKVESFGNYLLIDSEYYTPKFGRNGKSSQHLRFVRVPKKQFEKMKKLAKRLAPKLNKVNIMYDALTEIPAKQLNKVYNIAMHGTAKPKIRTRYGCVDLIVGKEEISIR